MKNKLPWIILGVFLLWVGYSLLPKSPAGIDHAGFGKLPVLLNGRLQPMDSVAMNALLQIRGIRNIPLEGFDTEGNWGKFQELPYDMNEPFKARSWYDFDKHPDKLDATQWLMEVMMRPELADERYLFAVNHPDLISNFDLNGKGLDRSGLRFFSFHELQPHIGRIEAESGKVNEKPELRTPYERAIAKLSHTLVLYLRLKNSLQPQDTDDFAAELNDYLTGIGTGVEAAERYQNGEDYDEAAFTNLITRMERYDAASRLAYPLLVPPAAPDEKPDDWNSVGKALMETVHTRNVPEAVTLYAGLSSAYNSGDADGFNAVLARYRDRLNVQFPQELSKAEWEHLYNRFSPFHKSIVLYIVAFLLACCSWFRFSEWMNRSAHFLILLAVLIHTTGLVTRMILENRPPVTNLYSSAIFVGWGAVILGLVLERFYRDGIGNVIAGIVGFLTLLIAHNLSLSGDTMEMMQAVLDTNFWLATHVVVITLGYSATFVAGFLSLVYIARGLFTKTLSRATAKGLARMVYGIICFATLFSFVGTVLGGIWADQSWGRFWGWDPKENGALMIVIWNALILHCRWGGIVREQGLINLAVIGNVITAFSWFGVNLLSIGLHSYGFMDGSFQWMVIFTISQMFFLGLGVIPQRYWLSFSKFRSEPSTATG